MGLISVKNNCVNPDLRGNQSCVECYFSQVEDNTWVGSQGCWRTGCIASDLNEMRVDRLEKVVATLRESNCRTWMEFLER